MITPSDLEQFQQEAKDVLFEISQSQGVHDVWQPTSFTTKIRSNNMQPHKCRSSVKKHRVETEVSFSHRDESSQLQPKMNSVITHDTSRSVLSHRTQCRTARINHAKSKSSKKCSSNFQASMAMLLPTLRNMPPEQKSMKMRILQGALLPEKTYWERQQDLKSNYYKKFNKYQTAGLRHEPWGDYVMHLPSLLQTMKPIR